MSSTTLAADRLGNLIGDGIGAVMSSALDEMMKGVWEGATGVLRTAFGVVDQFSTFTVATDSGPVGAVWPTLLTVSAVFALGLFFWQLTLSSLRGGRGMMQVATGPLAYGIALAMTVGAIGGLLAAADGISALLLSSGLKSDNFTAAFTHTSLGGQTVNGVKTVALGLIGLFGLIPAGLGWALEIIWRQAAILVLVATVPITAAGLLAQTTASWFWRGLRWMFAAIAMKPVLALIVVVGVSALAGADGAIGLLAGVGVLWVSLVSPVALFRLLAFVDPATDAGATFREQWQQFRSNVGSAGGAGLGLADSTGSNAGGSGGGSGQSSGGGHVGAFEAANEARFDDASGGGSSTSTALLEQDAAPPPPSTSGPDSASSSSNPTSAAGGTRGGRQQGQQGEQDQPPPDTDPPSPPDRPDDPGPTGPSGGSGDGGPRPPKGSGPRGGPGGGGAAAAGSEVEAAAVIV